MLAQLKKAIESKDWEDVLAQLKKAIESKDVYEVKATMAAVDDNRAEVDAEAGVAAVDDMLEDAQIVLEHYGPGTDEEWNEAKDWDKKRQAQREAKLSAEAMHKADMDKFDTGFTDEEDEEM